MMQLLSVLHDTRARLAEPGNDFVWSRWGDQAEALAELDRHLSALVAGQMEKGVLDLLFAPTGSIQEVSISSGWGVDFLALAERYDAAIAEVSPL
jgi:hypothetical protein